VTPDGLLAEFKIDLAPIWPVEDGRLEPIFLAPLAAEIEEFRQLDPERGAGEPDEPLPAPRRRASGISLLGSLGVHLLTLIVLIAGNSAPAEISGGIPMHLVIEEAPPAPDEAPPEPSVSATTDEAPQADSGTAPNAAAPSVPPPQIPVAAAVPPPKPSPPPPAPTPKQAIASAAPEPAANPAPLQAEVPGSGTARGDYLDYLVTLTRGHFDILPLAFLAGRHGRTTLSVLVLEDGSIGSISVKRSSGYPDIDSKIEQMVAAVGRFPPPPEWFKRPAAALDFNMIFPDALQR
jgi:TonB family protein